MNQYIGRSLLVALTFLLVSCGSSNSNTASLIGNISSPGATLNLQFVNESETQALARLPSTAETYTVQLFDGNGSLVQEKSSGRVSGMTFSDLPFGPTLVRLMLSNGSGILGYSDRSIVVTGGTNFLLFDNLLAGEPPSPSIDLGTEPLRLGFLSHPRDVLEGQEQLVEVVVLAGDGSRVTDFNGDIHLVASSGESFALTDLSSLFRATVSITTPDSNIRLTASSALLLEAQSLPFDVTQSQLEFSAISFPTMGQAMIDLDAPVVLELHNANGDLVTTASQPISASIVALGGSSPSAVLQGTTTVTAVNGVVTFADLIVSEEGSFSLVISGDGVMSFQRTIQIGPAPTTGLLYILDLTSDTLLSVNNSSVADGPANASSLTLTNIGTPHGIAIDTQRDRGYVGNLAGKIGVYNNISTLTGNTAPDTIVSVTGVAAGFGVFLDQPNDRLYFATDSDLEIAVIDNASALTNVPVAPTRLLRNFPNPTRYPFVDGRGRLLVTTSTEGIGDGKLYVFPDASSVDGDVATTSHAELTFSGSASFMGVGVSADNRTAYVSDFSDKRLIAVDIDNPVSGPATELRIVSGANAEFSSRPRGLSVDTFRNEVYLAVGSKVLIFPESADGDIEPSRSIQLNGGTGFFSGLFIDFTRM